MSSGRYTKVVTGYEDVFLTGQPRTSYFLKRYSKKLPTYEAYIIETNILDQVNYGTLLRTVIPEKGDIIKGIIIKVVVPTDYISIYASYALIEYCDLIIGGQLIDRLTGEYMNLMSDKKCSTTQQQSIGIFSTTITNKFLKNDAGFTQLFFEIPFYFFNKLHLGIPICALYKHKVEFHIKIKEWTLLKETYINNTQFYYFSKYIDNKRDDVVPMKLFSTIVEYIKLPDEIRESIKNSTMTYTITQVQLQNELIPKYDNTFHKKLKFINPVHNLLFYFRSTKSEYLKNYGSTGSYLEDLKLWGLIKDIPDTYINQITDIVHTYGNTIFKTLYGNEAGYDNKVSIGDYNLYYVPTRYCTLQHLINMNISFNGENIIDPENSGHFLMMNQTHKLMKKGVSNIPMIYSVLGVVPDYSPCYYFHSFAEDFKSENPGGQVNFSRIIDKDLYINLVPSLYDRVLHIYAESNNVLKIKDGMGGLMFTSSTDYNPREFLPETFYYNIIYFTGNIDPNTNGTTFLGLEKQVNTPYAYIYKTDYPYPAYSFYVWFYNGTEYVIKTSGDYYKYLITPDIIVGNNPKPIISLS